MSHTSDENATGGAAIPEDAGEIFSLVHQQFYIATRNGRDVPLFSLATAGHSVSQATPHPSLEGPAGQAEEPRGVKKRLKAQRVRSKPATVCDEGVPLADIFPLVQAQFYQHVWLKEESKPMFQMNPEPPPPKPVKDINKKSTSPIPGSAMQLAGQKKRERKRTRTRKNKKDESSPDEQDEEVIVPRKHGNVDGGENESKPSKSAEIVTKPDKKTAQQRRKEKARNARKSGGSRSSSLSEVVLSPGKAKPQKAVKSPAPVPPRVADVKPAQFMSNLEKDFIYPLKKPPVAHQSAKFFCRLCNYHLNDVGHCHKHLKDNRHVRLKRLKTADLVYQSIPPATEAHANVLSRLLQRVCAEQGLSPGHVRTRQAVTDRIGSLLKDMVPDAGVNLYGSSRNGFGLKRSDINIDVKAEKAASALKLLYKAVKEDASGYYGNVESDFSAHVPSVLFTIPSLSSLRVQVGVSTGSTFGASSLTTELLHTYCSIDSRVQALGVPLRYWAKLCKIDRQEQGTLPAYVFGLMTVYFLQQCRPPVLPVLHEIGSASEKNGGCSGNFYFNNMENLSAHWQCANTESVGALWLRMCRFYALDFDNKETVICIRQRALLKRSEKKWTKRLPIEDPFMRRRNVTRSLSHASVFEYIYDRLRAMYQYFAIPRTRDGPVLKGEDFAQLEHAVAQNVKSEQLRLNQTSADEYGQSSVPSKIDGFSFGRGNDFKFSFKIEDENVKKDSSKSAETDKYLSELAEHVIRDAVKTVAGQHETDTETVASQSAVTEAGESSSSQGTGGAETAADLVSLASSIVDSVIAQGVKLTSSDFTPGPRAIKDTGTSDRDEKGDTMRAECGQAVELYDLKKVAALTEEDYVYSFDAKHLTDKTGPALCCAICQKQGHLKQNCPDEKLPEIRPLPALTRRYNAILTKLLTKVPSDFEPSQEEYWCRQDLCSGLEAYIQQIFPRARLSLFGSSMNGFSFSHSDLDICMVFSDKPGPEGVDVVDVIEAVYRHLKKHAMLKDVHAIVNAKVPIIKFIHKQSNLEGDISLYNTLAVHNTRMLELYSRIDYRVRALGYTMKVFAKLCDICDASRGSLSSYAYILMVIYFLQQRSPPVVPVLQELHDGEKPECLVDGWNAWYYSGGDTLSQVWPGMSRNQESLAQLWIGLLRFYTEEFNFRDFVISIRQKEPLTRFEKLWNGKCIAIEDPFDLSHNLGAGLSAKMNTFILKAFHNGRSHFGVPIETIPPQYRSIEDYLFDPKIMTEGPPPADRNCRACGRIGHWAKECHTLENRREEERNKENKEQKQREKKDVKEKEKKSSQSVTSQNGSSENNGKTSSAKNSKQQKSRQGTKQESRKKQERPAEEAQGQTKAKSQGRSKSASGAERDHRKPAQQQQQQDKTDQNGGARHRKVFYNSQHASQRSHAPMQPHQPPGKVLHPPHHTVSHGLETANVKHMSNQLLNPPGQFQNQYGPTLMFMNPNPQQVGFFPVTSGHTSHNPVQQLLMSGVASQVMPAMPPSHYAYQNTVHRQVTVASHNPNEGKQSPLTWQQTLMQRQMEASPRGKKARKVQNPSQRQQEQFPNLEIKVTNNQMTWQQQEMAQMSHKRNRKRDRAHAQAPRSKQQ